MDQYTAGYVVLLLRLSVRSVSQRVNDKATGDITRVGILSISDSITHQTGADYPQGICRIRAIGVRSAGLSQRRYIIKIRYSRRADGIADLTILTTS